MRVKFHPGARADLREGRKWYASKSPLAAIAFAEAIESAVNAILEAPERYAQSTERGAREYVLPRRFPYTVVYRVIEPNVVIVAVAHHSREPGYWHSR